MTGWSPVYVLPRPHARPRLHLPAASELQECTFCGLNVQVPCATLVEVNDCENLERQDTDDNPTVTDIEVPGGTWRQPVRYD